MVVRLRRGCGKPPRVAPGEASWVRLPPKDMVLERLRGIVGDDAAYSILASLVDVIYSMPGDHEFIAGMVKPGMVAYRVAGDPDLEALYMAAMTLALNAYCFGGLQGLTSLSNVDVESLDPYCRRALTALAAVRAEAEGLPKWKAPLVVRRLDKAIGRLVKEWKKRIERGWCRRNPPRPSP